MATGAARKTITPFDTRDGFTKIHNHVIDHMMPTLKPNAFKVLVFIIRKTKGWGKDADRISYSQLRDGTGIKSDATLSAALAELEELQYILTEKQQGLTNNYILNTTLEIVVAGTSTDFVGGTSTEIEEVPLQKLKTQKKEKEKERKSADASREESPAAHHSPAPVTPTEATGELQPLLVSEEPEQTAVTHRQPTKKRQSKTPNPPARRRPPSPTPEAKALMERHKALVVEFEGERALSLLTWPQEWVGIKKIAAAELTPEEYEFCYRDLRRDKFYTDKHLAPQTVAKQAGAILARLDGRVVDGAGAVELAYEW